MMRKEIEILLRALSKHCTVVEKTTNVAWTEEELLDAGTKGRFQEPDHIAPPDPLIAVSGPFPACGRQMGDCARSLDDRLLGQTTHFVIFSELDGDRPGVGMTGSLRPR
jgi:hypothetical protein